MGRDKQVPQNPLPWEKVPLYFRRAAINSAIAAAKSHISRQKSIPGRKAEKLHSAVTYYKGMYRDFSHKEITLKVWTGEQWKWMRCRLYGREFPAEAELMSPSVTFEKKYLMLHVPVKEFTADTATVKQRNPGRAEESVPSSLQTEMFLLWGQYVTAQGRKQM